MCISPDLEFVCERAAVQAVEISGPQEEILNYLKVGEEATISGENCRAVLESTLRELLLAAGYTEFALACLGWNKFGRIIKPATDDMDIGKSDLTFAVHGPNIYGLGEGEFNTIETVKNLVESKGPDCENDELAARVLGNLQKMSFLQKQEREQQLGFVSFGCSWRFHIDGSMTFLLNPIRGIYRLGWYSIEEIEALLAGDQGCLILSKNDQIYDLSPDLPSKKIYECELKKLSKASPPDLRLIRIALMKCPFPDLVQQYSHLL